MEDSSKKKHTWTEADLREVVAKCKSWRDVLRAFGYSPTSGAAKERMRRAVLKFDISTEHFTGQRRWTDAQLIRAVETARTWQELFRAMNMKSGNSAEKAMIKSHALRLALDLDPLERSAPEVHRDVHDIPAQRNQLRRAAPSIAMAWFLARGIPVFVPPEPEPYDLVAELSVGFQKVQVKSSTRRDKYGRCNAGIAPRRTHGPNKDMAVPYDPDDVDLFFIVDADGWMYLIPMKAVAGYCGISLNAYKQYRCGRADGLLAGIDDDGEMSEAA